MDHRRIGIDLDRLPQQVAGAQGIERAQPGQPLGVEVSRLRIGRQQRGRRAGVGRRGLGPSEGAAAAAARSAAPARTGPSSVPTSAKRGHACPPPAPSPPGGRSAAWVASRSRRGKSRPPPGRRRAGRGSAAGSPLPGSRCKGAERVLLDAGDLLARDHPHLGAGRQLGGQHLGQRGGEPVVVRSPERLRNPSTAIVGRGGRVTPGIGSPGRRFSPLSRRKETGPTATSASTGPGSPPADQDRPAPAAGSERRARHRRRGGSGAPAAGPATAAAAGCGAPRRGDPGGSPASAELPCRFARDLEDLGDEAVPPARHGHHEPVVVRPLSQRLAQGRDVLRQVGLGDEGVRPDPSGSGPPCPSPRPGSPAGPGGSRTPWGSETPAPPPAGGGGGRDRRGKRRTRRAASRPVAAGGSLSWKLVDHEDIARSVNSRRPSRDLSRAATSRTAGTV